jgi:hypothetical protein
MWLSATNAFFLSGFARWWNRGWRPATFTTIAFDDSSLRWLEINT